MLAIQPSSIPAQPALPLSERVKNKIVETAQAIVADSERRLSQYQKDVKVLSEGCFYGGEYMEILKNNPRQKARFDYLVEKGAFYNGWVDPKCFRRIENKKILTGITPLFFVLKDGVDAVTGLKAAKKGLSFIGCGEICQISQYESILSEIGEEKFKKIFHASSSTPLSIGLDSEENPLLALYSIQLDSKKFNKGDLVGFENIPRYTSKHINGNVRGFNAICCDSTEGNETFTTLGLPSAGIPAAAVHQVFIDAFNSPQESIDGIVSEELAKRIQDSYSPEDQATTASLRYEEIDMNAFLAEGGGKVVASISLNFDRIERLVREPLATVASLYASWKH